MGFARPAKATQHFGNFECGHLAAQRKYLAQVVEKKSRGISDSLHVSWTVKKTQQCWTCALQTSLTRRLGLCKCKVQKREHKSGLKRQLLVGLRVLGECVALVVFVSVVSARRFRTSLPCFALGGRVSTFVLCRIRLMAESKSAREFLLVVVLRLSVLCCGVVV